MFVVMSMPRVLARRPFGANTAKIEEFNFEELPLGENGESIRVPHDNYSWMNAAYVLGAQMTDAFFKTGWCTRTVGFANGGKVTDLPTHVFVDTEGDEQQKCPTEVGITDNREFELSELGFLPLSHYKDTNYAVFFGGQTCRKPAEKFSGPDAEYAKANERLASKLQYIMAVSRISHFLKVGARDAIGRSMERKDCEEWLNHWIAQYVLQDEQATEEMKAKFPLADAKIEVVPGDAPGRYEAVAYLRPWLQLEQLKSSMRLVAEIPQRQ